MVWVLDIDSEHCTCTLVGIYRSSKYVSNCLLGIPKPQCLWQLNVKHTVAVKNVAHFMKYHINRTFADQMQLGIQQRLLIILQRSPKAFIVQYYCLTGHDVWKTLPNILLLHMYKLITTSLNLGSSLTKPFNNNDLMSDNETSGQSNYQQHCAQRNEPVFNLLRGRFWGFSPRRGNTLHRWGEIWHVEASVPNFNPIGATIRV